jgi:hypothetical protein
LGLEASMSALDSVELRVWRVCGEVANSPATT